MATEDSVDFIKGWQSAQQQYWKNWWDMAQQTASTMQDGDLSSLPWHEGLELWSRFFRAPRPVQNDLMEKLMLNAKQYMTIMQSTLNRRVDQPPPFFDAAKIANPWVDALKNAFNIPGMDRSFLINNPMATALHEAMEQGTKSLQQMMTGMEQLAAPFQHEAKSLLSIPAFGYLREHQEHYQKMAQAWMDYQEALGRYNALILKSSQRSFDILENKLAERAEPGRQLDSMRALYDLWVDAAEEAYAEIALSDEFREVYGAVVNAQMGVRSQIQQEVERISVNFGVPTRTELNSVHQRLHEIRREIRRQQELPDLSQEITNLRAEVAALKKQATPENKESKKSVAEKVIKKASVKTSKSFKN